MLYLSSFDRYNDVIRCHLNFCVRDSPRWPGFSTAKHSLSRFSCRGRSSLRSLVLFLTNRPFLSAPTWCDDPVMNHDTNWCTCAIASLSTCGLSLIYNTRSPWSRPNSAINCHPIIRSNVRNINAPQYEYSKALFRRPRFNWGIFCTRSIVVWSTPFVRYQEAGSPIRYPRK